MRWLVVNQSHNQDFEQLLRALAPRLGRCLLLSGSSRDGGDREVAVLRGPRYDRRSYIRRALSWLTFTAWASWRIVAAGRLPVLSVSNPPILPLLTWALSKVRRTPYALLLWDLYPEHLVHAGWIRQGGWIERAWRRLNRSVLADAEVLITLGSQMAERVASDAGTSREVRVIPMWVDTDRISPDSGGVPACGSNEARGDLLVLYSGNMGATHGMGTVAEAAHLLRETADLRFLLVGDGLGRSEVERRVAELALENVTLLPRQPEGDVPTILARADIGLVLQGEGTGALSVPSKTYALLAAGVPIVATSPPGSDLAHLIEEGGVGLRTDPGDGPGLAEAIRTLAADGRTRKAMAARAREVAVERYGKATAVEAFDRALRPLVPARTAV